MEEEIIQLKAEVEALKSRCARLEDELDDLAMDNDRLRKLTTSGIVLGSTTGFTSRNVTSHSNNSGGGVIGNFTGGNDSQTDTANATIEWRELLVDGDDNCMDRVHTKIENAAGGMNVLCVAFCTYPGVRSDSSVHLYESFACGGVDKYLRIYGTSNNFDSNLSQPALLRSYQLSAPILCIDCYGHFVACSLMDGSHAVINISTPEDTPDVTKFSDHTKYVVTVKWSPDGIFLVTVSHDKTVNLYKKSFNSDGTFSFLKVHTARFMVTPECAVFAKNSKKAGEILKKEINTKMTIDNYNDVNLENLNLDDMNIDISNVDVEVTSEKEVEKEGEECEWELIIALRDTPHLTYLHCGTYVQRFISLNEAVWDTHCSFTPLHLAISPNKKYLLIATDKNFHFIVKIGENKRLRFLAGAHSSGDFGKPRVSWDCTGKYVYCNNEEGTSISVYSVSTEKPVRSITVHTGSVRDVVCHPVKSVLLTASYDKSVTVLTAPVMDGILL